MSLPTISAINEIAGIIKEGIKAAKDYKIAEAQEITARERIDAQKEVLIRYIDANHNRIMRNMDRSYDERKLILDGLIDLMHTYKENQEFLPVILNKLMEFVATGTQAITNSNITLPSVAFNERKALE